MYILMTIVLAVSIYAFIGAYFALSLSGSMQRSGDFQRWWDYPLMLLQMCLLWPMFVRTGWAIECPACGSDVTVEAEEATCGACSARLRVPKRGKVEVIEGAGVATTESTS